jgi:DNA-binding CsgD family transcriptional regulator
MSLDSKFSALIPRTETLGSNDREAPPFAAGLLSRWHARSASDHSAQLSSRGSDGLTARERDVLAMISQGCSNKRIARSLEISPETVKSHVKRIFLKLAVSTRTEAVFRAVSLELLSCSQALLRRPLRAHGSPEINTACPPSGGYIEQCL